jgi:general secretion pathway protein G
MMKSARRGFTLIELMVVITIIAILSTIALFGINKAQASARDVSRQQIMNGLRTALERYYSDNQAYYTTTNNFCGLTAALVAAGYLPSQPNDPSTKAAICGSGNPTAGGATYTYVGAAGSYTLTLAKESGGSSTFLSPQ